MALKKDKQKVLGEHFDDDRVRSFLEPCTQPGVNDDFAILERAYRGMKADNFATFLGFFVEAGKDINSSNPDGATLLSLVQGHQASSDYTRALINHGAHV